MIGYITDKFFRSYIMSPRIVLLFLGLVIAICKADVEKPTITYTTIATTAKLSCAFAASSSSGGDCYFGTTTGCKVKFYLSTDLIHTGDSDIALEYTPTRNGIYTCRAFTATEESDKSDPPSTPVNNLPAQATLTYTTVKSTLGCGEQAVLTCKAAATGGTAANTARLVIQNTTGTVAVELAKADKGPEGVLTYNVDNASNGWKYVCVAKSTTGTAAGLESNSEEKTLHCYEDAVPVAATSAATNDPAHTTGVSGGGGGGSDTTGSGGGGGKSGASDLGRPASLLTIVCFLLALTLSRCG